MQCKVVCYIGLLTLCCSHANVHVNRMLTLLSVSMIIDNEKAGSKYTHNLDN